VCNQYHVDARSSPWCILRVEDFPPSGEHAGDVSDRSTLRVFQLAWRAFTRQRAKSPRPRAPPHRGTKIDSRAGLRTVRQDSPAFRRERACPAFGLGGSAFCSLRLCVPSAFSDWPCRRLAVGVGRRAAPSAASRAGSAGPVLRAAAASPPAAMAGPGRREGDDPTISLRLCSRHRGRRVHQRAGDASSISGVISRTTAHLRSRTASASGQPSAPAEHFVVEDATAV